jgi:hypothetical protein
MKKSALYARNSLKYYNIPVEDCPGLLLVGAVEDVECDGLDGEDKGGDVLVTQPLLGRYAASPLLVVTLHVHPTRG